MEQLVPQPQIALPNVPQVGDFIAEKYRVEGILGVGGMGVVLRARHLQLGQVVAIKVLTVNSETQGDCIERFLREGRAAAALGSDHVVRIYDVGQLPTGIPFMVMEPLRGLDLATLLAEKGPLSIADAVEYIAQATLAIIEAHEVGIVHRDLKPSNLFLTHRSDATPCIKVLDFGISKQLSGVDAETMRAALTSTRQVMGSPAYMSPEQVRDAKSVDHRTDLWALGVTLYELLTQRPAFDADTLPAVCAAIAADPPVALRARRPDVPEALEALVMRCLEKTPAKRFPSARALLQALRGFQGRTTGSSAEQGNPPSTHSSAQADFAKFVHQPHGVELTESGPRSVDSVLRDPSDGTLVSGRTPVAFRDTNSMESGRSGTHAGGRFSRGRLLLLGLLVLVLGGVITMRIVNHGAAIAGPGKPSAPSTATTHFVLRISSEPAQALVLEGGNPLGVTPLALEIDRSVVQRAPRQFVMRKEGFLEVAFQQGDSATDVQQQITLPKGTSARPVEPATPFPSSATAPEPRPWRPGKPATKAPAAPSQTSSAIPAGDIRISR